MLAAAECSGSSLAFDAHPSATDPGPNQGLGDSRIGNVQSQSALKSAIGAMDYWSDEVSGTPALQYSTTPDIRAKLENRYKN